jgi:sodium/hydrogen antiporter
VRARSVQFVTFASLVLGFALGQGGLGALPFDARSGFVGDLALVALIVILFRDGLEVEAEMLQAEWRLPLRKLVLAMPLTAGLVALATRWLTGLGWTESFLVGALLSPTDPVLTSSVVTNPRVPRVIRHSLNLESGMNDGLALPAVLALIAALERHHHHFTWWRFVLQDVSLGLACGVAVGLAAAWLLPARHRILALGTAFAAYGVAMAVDGNGIIAAFVCAIVLGIRRPDVRREVEPRAGQVVEAVKLGIFFVFGSVLTLHGLFGDGAAAVGVAAFTLLLARPVAVFVAVAGTRTDRAQRAFMAWFGPKGVATMTFALLVLTHHVRDGTRIFNLAALTVIVSVLAHGVTDAPGAGWIARRAAVAP